MKRILCMICLLSGTVSFAQKKQELLNELKEGIGDLDRMINFSNTKISFSTGDTKFDPTDKSQFEQYKVYNEKRVTDFFDSLHVGAKLSYPYSYLEIDNDHFDLLSLLGKSSSYHLDRPEEKPRYIPKRITFLDGTDKDAKGLYCSPATIEQKYGKVMPGEEEYGPVVDPEKLPEPEQWLWSQKSSFNESFMVLDPRPIKKVAFTIELPLRKSVSDTLDAARRTMHTQWGDITLEGINGKRVNLSLPDALDEQLEIRALYKDGRILSQKSYSSQTQFSEQKIAALKTFRTVLEEAQKKVNTGEISNKKELEEYVKANAPAALTEEHEEEEKGGQRKSAQYSFSGPVSRVVFIISDTTLQVRRQDVVYELRYHPEEMKYQVAADFVSGKTGIVNVQGKWVVKPQYDQYFRSQNAYYYWDQIDDYEATYWFDHKTETLHKVAYRLDELEVYDGKYVKIEPKVNGNTGLAAVSTGEEVLPMRHEFLRLKEGRFWIAGINRKEGAYDRDLKVVIPFEFDDVDYQDGYFYTRSPNELKDVYNHKGQNITKGKYQDIDGHYNSGLLKVESYTIGADRVVKNRKQFYIDTMGKEQIALQAKDYSDAEPFSAGLALVRKEGTGKYGFIDRSGKVAIPCTYGYARSFFEKSQYALVELEDGTQVLIDKQGKPVKKLEEHYRSISFDEKSGLFQIGLDNGKRYDEYGKPVE